MRQQSFFEILNKEMVPALGCTDPIGVAYAAACAKKYAQGEIISITGELSVNIIKNAAAVCIPGTDGKCGVTLALALGAVAGDSDKGLEVLSGIDANDVQCAEKLINDKKAVTCVAENNKKLYMKISLKTKDDEVEVVIEDGYTNVISVIQNGTVLVSESKPAASAVCQNKLDYSVLSVDSILTFANEVQIEKLGLIEKAVNMNIAVAKEGLAREYGLAVGMNVKQLLDEGYISDDLVNTAMMWTTAGTDARMAG
jgi:L-cysteine desulfidase